MCTLAISAGQDPEWPLVVAANRDESLTRPSSPPLLWREALPFLAPRDEQAGGTWLGLNAAGMFVGITNRFGAANEQHRDSRGTLVLEALRQPGVDALHTYLSTLDPKRFNAFHLLYADAREVGITWTDGETLTQERPSAGLHVISERSFGAADAPRVDFVRARFSPDPKVLKTVLAHHDEGDPLSAPCVHVPSFNYGTRSSIVLRVHRDPARSEAWWAEGAPCRTPFHAISDQVRDLLTR